ncbi:MAG: hypothetical protein IT198_08390 [Acidimicrobiia bacterium]|nr:hypothetical protein [Acidimicrobiia bacterium]
MKPAVQSPGADISRFRFSSDDILANHVPHSKASPRLFRYNRRVERLRREVRQLRLAYPSLTIDPDWAWVLIEDFRLPDGWQPSRTAVLIKPPLSYPDAAPDGFYLGARLRKQSGGTWKAPGHYFDRYKNPYASLGYYWYCLEDPDGSWDPQRDSLLTFVEAIRTYLGTGD